MKRRQNKKKKEKKKDKVVVQRSACPLTSEVLLAGHVIPNAVHLLWGDLVDGDNPPVSTETVSHFPVIETTVLIRVYTQLTQTQSHIHVLQVQQFCV